MQFMSRPCVIVVDQGTSATKGFLFNESLEQLHTQKIRHTVKRPRRGWVECDAGEIAYACRKVMERIAAEAASRSLTIAAVGMAFQRSTFLFWGKDDGEPKAPAMSWQDSRATELVKEMAHESADIQQLTGIPLTGHFGGPKFLHTVKSNDVINNGVKKGTLFFGPLSAFVAHRLTGSSNIDQSIAGRSLLMNLSTLAWDDHLLDLFEVMKNCLPHIVPTCHNYGTITIDGNEIPLLCVMGDQQASLIGQGRWEKGDVALNFGTSGSVLVNSGETPLVVPSLLSNVLFSSDDSIHFLLEGTINSVGSLFKWLEGYFGITHDEMNWDNRCSTETDGIIVSGLNGISAPYWTGEFETQFFGLDRKSDPDELVRAGMESIGFLVNDICEVIQKEAKIELADIVASGGSSRTSLLQFIADILRTDIATTSGKDMTALGVARLVAHSAFGTPLGSVTERDEQFHPVMTAKVRDKKIFAWHDALRKLSILTN
jgi:glycerol kinase